MSAIQMSEFELAVNTEILPISDTFLLMFCLAMENTHYFCTTSASKTHHESTVPKNHSTPGFLL